MKKSKHQHDSSEEDDSPESEVEKKVKRKHKKSSHSKHEAHKKKAKKEEPESSSSESEEEKIEKVKKSHHKKKKKKVKQESSSSSSSKTSSSSESEEEKVKKSHHKKKKHKHEQNIEKVRVKEDPEEVKEEKPRLEEGRRHHHHKHRHHRDRTDVDRHGHSSRTDRESSRPDRESSRPDRESKWNRQSNEQETNSRDEDRRNDRDPERRIKEERRSQEIDRRQDRNREERRPHQRPEHSGKRNKKPFCDEASEEYEWGRKDNKQGGDNDPPQEPKQKPNFGLSGKLTEDTNMYNGVVIKYSEPPDARKPKRRWRLYPFKGETALPVLHIHRQSAFLMGRDRKVADIPVDHPSCSKQHAALQYRLTDYTRDDGSKGKRIRLYIIDLESANGTFVNNKRIDPKRYVELLEKDVIKFGFSLREYVLLHEHSKDSDADDDVQEDE